MPSIDDILSAPTELAEDYDSESTEVAIASKRADIIPRFETSELSTTIEDSITTESTIKDVVRSDLQIANVQIMSLLHGLGCTRTIDGLVKVNDCLSRTLRYRRDILNMPKQKDDEFNPKSDRAVFVID